MNDGLGKKAEQKIRDWLNKPEDGYCLDRIPDQLSGFYGSQNICDFTLFKAPYMFYIESKATWKDRFDFSLITEYQYNHMLEKSRIKGVYSIIIVLFADAKRAFILNIRDIDHLQRKGKKSINIKKIDKWEIPYIEIPTIPNSRKILLDYTGDYISLIEDTLIGRTHETSNSMQPSS